MRQQHLFLASSKKWKSIEGETTQKKVTKIEKKRDDRPDDHEEHHDV